jgi:DNA-directed RNA polymerase subunit beta
MPLMTSNGTFVINGTERVIVSQMHRSPGVFFDHDRGKTHSSGKLLFAARIIPYRGSWLDFEFDAKDIVYVRIDRRRKLPVTTLLYALGLEDEEILSTFYDRITLKATKEGWRMPFKPDRLRGIKPVSDLIDAKTGKVAIEAGRKVTARLAKKLADEGLKELLVSDEDLHGRYLAQDIINMETGEIYGEAGDELDAKLLEALHAAKIKEFPILDIDHVQVGASDARRNRPQATSRALRGRALRLPGGDRRMPRKILAKSAARPSGARRRDIRRRRTTVR